MKSNWDKQKGGGTYWVETRMCHKQQNEKSKTKLEMPLHRKHWNEHSQNDERRLSMNVQLPAKGARGSTWNPPSSPPSPLSETVIGKQIMFLKRGKQNLFEGGFFRMKTLGGGNGLLYILYNNL